MDEELAAIERNNTWKLTELPKRAENNRCEVDFQDQVERKW